MSEDILNEIRDVLSWYEKQRELTILGAGQEVDQCRESIIKRFDDFVTQYEIEQEKEGRELEKEWEMHDRIRDKIQESFYKDNECYREKYEAVFKLLENTSKIAMSRALWRKSRKTWLLDNGDPLYAYGHRQDIEDEDDE